MTDHENSFCPCEISISILEPRESLVEKFSIVRTNCSALKEILVPDSVWPRFKEIALIKDAHISNILNAFSGGYLIKFTSPVHKFLLKNGKPKASFKKAYKNDLSEKWMINKKHILPRHQESKGYLGKITELQVAEWLEEQGWVISGLEALCSKSDIEATSPNGVECAFEIKHLGQDDEDFLHYIENYGGNYCPQTASNFLVSRAYEAANQLLKLNISNAKIILIVISNSAWNSLQFSINDNLIDWQFPKFSWPDEECEEKICYNDCIKFLKKCPTHIDLCDKFKAMDELWITKRDNDYTLSVISVAKL